MAIAFDAVSSVNSSAASYSSPITLAHTCTGANLVLVVGVTYQDPNHGNYGSDTVTYNGVSLTKVRSDEAIGDIYTEIWILVGPATGAHNIVVTPSSVSSLGEIGVGGISLTGARQTGQPESHNGATGYSNTASVVVTTIENNSWVVDVLANEGGEPTAGAGQTRRWYETDQPSEHGAGSTEGPKTPAGAVTMSWSIPSAWCGMSAVSIAPVAATYAPTVTTTSPAVSITDTSAVVYGNVTDDGDSTITERGVCYGASANPTTADDTVTNPGTTGEFNCNISGLTASTTYHVRAYAINAVGTSYGADVEFTTSSSTSAVYLDDVKPMASVVRVKPLTEAKTTLASLVKTSGQTERFYPVTSGAGQPMGLLLALTYKTGFTVNSSKST